MPRFTSPPIPFIKEMFARTPTARTKTSKRTVFPLFIKAVFLSKDIALSFNIKLIPFCSRCFCIIAAQSASRILESTRSARSHIVILETRSFKPSAHFKPMRPAPTINTSEFSLMEASSSSISSIVIKECFCSTDSRPVKGGTKGEEPVAMQSLS